MSASNLSIVGASLLGILGGPVLGAQLTEARRVEFGALTDGTRIEAVELSNRKRRPDFPSPRLNPGETYVNAMVFRFSAVSRRP